MLKKLDKKSLKSSSKDKKSSSKDKKSIKNCKNYKLRKEPKCNDQEGCKWVVNKGCLNK